MAWTNPTDATVSQVLRAARWNAEVRDNLRYLKGQAGAITLENYVLANVGSLGTASGDTAIIGREQMSVSNQFRPTRWLRRFAAGTDWNNVALHDGIDIDGAFPTPGTSTRTWYERRPNNQQHLWGDGGSTWMALNNGALGVGTASPQQRIHIKNENGAGVLFIGQNIGTSAVVVASGATVGAGFYGLARIQAAPTPWTVGVGGANNGTTSVMLHTNGSNYQLYMGVSAGGVVTMSCSAAAGSYLVMGWLYLY